MSEPSNQQNIYDGQGFQTNNPQASVFQGISNSNIYIDSKDLGLDRISRVEMNLYRSTPNFVGRQKELDRLHKILQQQEGAVISAVSGMGGVGKTQLAVEYATRHAADYPGGVCWLRAREQDLATQIIQIAEFDLNLKILDNPQVRSLPPEAIVQKCWQAWKPDGLVLVVLDDVIDWVTCQRFLPKLSRFRLLLTTRIQRLDADLFEIPLDVLSIEEAVELLAKLEKHGRVERDRATAIELCEALGRLPLGIELIGRYLFSRRALSLSKMLEQLQRQKLAIEALERSPQYAMTAQLGVRAAFELTWQPLSEDSQTVARLLGYFALAEIPWQVAEAMMQRVKGEEYSIFEAQTELENASVVQIVEEKTDVCKLHPLVREFLREKEAISVSETGEKPLQEAFLSKLISLASQMPSNPITKDIVALTPIRDHLQEVATHYAEELQGGDLIRVFAGLTWFYNGQGLFVQAEPWCAKCLQIAESRFEGDHADVAWSLNELAALYDLQRRLSEAEPLYASALEMRQRLFAGDHPDVALSLNNLAYLYRAQGRLSEAEPLYVQALEMRQRLFAGDHPDVAQSLNNLAGLYQAQGRLSEAEPFIKQTLAMRQRLFKGNHPDLAQSLWWMAFLSRSQGKFQEAINWYEQAVAMYENTLGANHPDTQNVRAHLEGCRR